MRGEQGRGILVKGAGREGESDDYILLAHFKSSHQLHLFYFI